MLLQVVSIVRGASIELVLGNGNSLKIQHDTRNIGIIIHTWYLYIIFHVLVPKFTPPPLYYNTFYCGNPFKFYLVLQNSNNISLYT